ncbi:MAG: energy-coupling factor ABC transporter ATP-binding protein [Clostridiales Family XIII bacterium]|jgi:energy-coupling factor transporter ATP-binding protein EcfA2|nr:energy-coupling factor ABC transporter ATP-binding protein [Clostridiales Family XIII bacterium]
MADDGKNSDASLAIETNGLGFAYSSDEKNDPPRDAPPQDALTRDTSPRDAATAGNAEAFSLRGVNLAIPRGTVNVVIGASGCGKTTLLRCLTGIIPSIIKGSLVGSIKLNGREIVVGAQGMQMDGSFVFSNEREIVGAVIRPNEISLMAGLVMQEPDHQIFMTTAEDDIAFGPENRMVAPDSIRATVDACARAVGLSDRLMDDPSTLSGGGKQRLAIAGILASAPDILLFDEPVSGLDESGRTMFATLIQELKEKGKTIVVVEHDYEEFSFADTWILMKRGEVIEVAPPDEIDRSLLEDGLWR